MIQDVPIAYATEINDDNLRDSKHFRLQYLGGEHEHVMAKSLFSAGTTWPGVFFCRDQKHWIAYYAPVRCRCKPYYWLRRLTSVEACVLPSWAVWTPE